MQNSYDMHFHEFSDDLFVVSFREYAKCNGWYTTIYKEVRREFRREKLEEKFASEGESHFKCFIYARSFVPFGL